MIAIDLGAQQSDSDSDIAPARNVILLVGDGMGQAHRFAGQLAAVGLGDRLVMDLLPVAGLMRTTCADPDTFVTDSAAAATAMACGVKTVNGAIGVDPAGVKVPSVLEIARWAGKRTGLVTTCQITDATPAAFAAHVPHRDAQREIARQFIEETGVDVLLGGGGAYWHPAAADPGATNGRQPPPDPTPDLVRRARDLGYRHADTAAELDAAINAGAPKLLGLFADQNLFTQRDDGRGDAYDPPVSLADLTRAALAVLSREPAGFFLVIEEAAIDRMAHRNHAHLVLRAVRALDEAVAVALEHAAAHPDTLVVVTADHETGGLAVAGPDDEAYPYEVEHPTHEEAELAAEDGPFRIAGSAQRFVMGWTTTGHTAAAVPVTAVGPGAEALAGAYENTHLFEALVGAMGLGAPIPAR